jgi:cupin 2 domain-containing protein
VWRALEKGWLVADDAAIARNQRIVSTGQVTLEGRWYDQDAHEWVMVVEGAARLRIEGESEERELGEGD